MERERLHANLATFLFEKIAYRTPRLFSGKRLHVPDTERLSRRKAPIEANISQIDWKENVGLHAAPWAVAPVGHPDPVFSILGPFNDVVRVWRRLAMPL